MTDGIATQDLGSLKSELIDSITAAGTLADLEAARVAVLGKKGRLTGLMKGLGALEGEARRTAGAALNEVKEAVASALQARRDVARDVVGQLDALELVERLEPADLLGNRTV